jgi:hypothetical protein
MTSKQKVSVDEVSLNVVGVSIKAVQIGKKQMTLSVFRQLPHEAVWDPETSEAKGIVWGRVNYFWFEAYDQMRAFRARSRYEPIHIIWQKGVELRRSYLYPDVGEDQSWYPFRRDLRRNDEGPPPIDGASNILAWWAFCDRRIATSDQLFIAV